LIRLFRRPRAARLHQHASTANPPDICGFGDLLCHRLPEKQIHLGLIRAKVERVVLNALGKLFLTTETQIVSRDASGL